MRVESNRTRNYPPSSSINHALVLLEAQRDKTRNIIDHSICLHVQPSTGAPVLLNKLRKKAHDFNKLSSPISPRTSFIIPWKLSRRLIVQLFFHPFHPSVTTASLHRFFNNRKTRLKLLTKEHELYRREQDRVSLNEEKRRVEGGGCGRNREREREGKKSKFQASTVLP